MIKVIRIAGESFDFETMKETPKALILSNGKSEFTLYVDDATATAVLKMMLNEDAPAPSKSNGSPANARATPVAVPQAPQSPVAESPKAPPMATVGEEEVPEDEHDNSGFEPGEEYNDPATGAESL